MKSSEQLRAAKELIKDPNNWIRGHYSDDAHVKFCMLGALNEVAEDGVASYDDAMGFLCCALPKRWGIPEFNDHPDTTHDAVMKVYEDAIKLAEEVEDGVEVHID